MRVKLTVVNDANVALDVLIEADSDATVGGMAKKLAQSPELGLNPDRSYTLQALMPGRDEWMLLPPEAVIGEQWLTPASRVALYDITDSGHDLPSTQAGTTATLRVLNGKQAGTEFLLAQGSHTVGRDPECEVTLADLFLSKRHFRIDVGVETEVIDLGSANGLELGGNLVSRIRVVNREEFFAGGTRMSIEVAEQAATSRQEASGVIGVRRSPRVETRYAGSTFKAPRVPQELEPQPFPILAMLTPLLMGGAMFVMTGRLASLIFIMMSPIMVIGNYFTKRKRERTKLARSIAKFEDALAGLRDRVEREKVAEHVARVAEIPASGDVLDAAARLSPLLWTRRAEHWNFLEVCLGRGPMPSRNVIENIDGDDMIPEHQERLDALIESVRLIDDVPLVASWRESGAIGVSGRESASQIVVNAIMAQVTGLHSPAEVVVAGVLSPQWARNLAWLKWLPHTASPHSPLAGEHLAGDQASGDQLLARLEELVVARSQERGSGGDAEVRGAINEDGAAWHGGAQVGSSAQSDYYAGPLPAVIVVISADAVADRARLVALSERAADTGVFPLWVGETLAELPAVCRAYVDAEAARVGLVRIGRAIEPVALDVVDAPMAGRYGRHMGRLTDADVPVAGAVGVPNRASLVGLIDPELLTNPSAALDRWIQNGSIHDRTDAALRTKARKRPGRLRAIVGAGADGPTHIDLRVQGPHALVGGTTGAGKSEFLQSWVLGMAAEYSPDRVTFLFVDYKGGAAFADCVNLPHCVGLVTDLSPHLVRRALTSLRAELHYREHLLNGKGAKDLAELEERGDPEAPPMLVIVIDEFAALVGEVPEFVDGVVDVAQRGRSLGIHLIMATQRPAGVIKDNLRANTNLRVALRMADESDSADVVGDKLAAHFDAGTPGRAVAKTGPGRLTLFQAGYAGGWSLNVKRDPKVEVFDLPFGRGSQWPELEEDAADEPEQDLGPTDQERMVSVFQAAAKQANLPEPRRPWLDELKECFDLASLSATEGGALPLGMCDEPERQTQSVAYFDPDGDGHMAIFGTGGSGKTVMLRSVAVTAALDGLTHVYGLDFASGGLRMLEPLPHVGAVVMGDDEERVTRLLRQLKDEVESRTARFAPTGAASISEYRSAVGGNPAEKRIILLIDAFGVFVDEWDTPAGGRSRWFRVFSDLVQSGRPLGIHVVFTVDRPGAVPSAIRSGIQRRVVLRLADDNLYAQLDVPGDVLDENSPPGRGIWGRLELQAAIQGGDGSTAAQSEAITALAEQLRAAGLVEAPGVGALPELITPAELGVAAPGQLLLGIGDEELLPVGIETEGVLAIAGPPQSGRSTLVATIAHQAIAAGMTIYHVGPKRSRIASLPGVRLSASTPESVSEMARALAGLVSGGESTDKVMLIIEGINDWLMTPADQPLTEAVRALKRAEHLVVSEAETTTWGGISQLLQELKAARRGILLQPESNDGSTVLRTDIGRATRADFPVGRGVLVAAGKTQRVQFACLDELAGDDS
ncbi:MAG: FtsK/SpoIIIE domain-containing protein [Promicromonosporaceae bacterium]|nr:FtsK/SpoIIIE domain-containing protein [Promicromonosporaceae bacterium]